jgi:hypothetical protein
MSDVLVLVIVDDVSLDIVVQVGGDGATELPVVPDRIADAVVGRSPLERVGVRIAVAGLAERVDDLAVPVGMLGIVSVLIPPAELVVVIAEGRGCDRADGQGRPISLLGAGCRFMREERDT